MSHQKNNSFCINGNTSKTGYSFRDHFQNGYRSFGIFDFIKQFCYGKMK